MRKSTLKKFIATFIAVLMVVSCMTALLSFVSFAEDGAPAVNDTIQISHVNAYTWGAYSSQIIYGTGKALNSAYDTDYTYWFVFEVKNINGTLTVTKAFGPGVAKDKTMTVLEGGFFLAVFSNEKNASSWKAAGNLAVGDTLTADFDYTVNAASETPIGTLTIHRNYAGTNLAAGIKAEEITDTIISSSNKDASIFTDGVYATSDNCTSGIGMYYNKVHGEATWDYQTLVYDLGGAKSIEGVRIQSFAKWGVWVAPEIRVYTSNDKSTWTLAKTVVPDGAEIGTTLLTTRIDFGAIARYVKFEFNFSASGNMIGLSEIEILGGNAVTVSSDEMAFTEANLIKLIDGSYAADATTFSDERLVGLNWEGSYGYSYATDAVNGTHDFTAILDLGTVKGLTGIKIGAYKELASFIDLPSAIKVYLSNDGANYVSAATGSWASTVTDLAASADRSAGLKGECIYTDSWATRAVLKARFIKFVFTLNDPWIFLSEIEAVTSDAEGHAIDEVALKGVDTELLGETVVVITSATDGFDIEAAKADSANPYRFVYNSNLTWAKWDPEKQAYIVTQNKINPWPAGHTGTVELAEDEILIAAQSAGSISSAGSADKWVMWKLEVGTELHIYDGVITVGKTLAGKEQQTFFTSIDVDTTGWSSVDGVTAGTWQTALAEGTSRSESYVYNTYIEGDNVITEIVYNGALSGADDSYGNGNGTNFRVWYYVPNAKIGDVACTTYTSFIDVSYTPSGVLNRFLNNTNPTGNTASVAYAYDAAEKPYTVESVIPFYKDGLYTKISIPKSVLGVSNAVELLITVSNVDATLGNNALYNGTYIKPYTEWKSDSAICLYPEYNTGVTQISGFSYLRGTTADLTDGNKHAEYAGWGNDIQNALIFQNPNPTTENGTIELVYNLGTAGEYNQLILSLYRDYSVMIGTPKEFKLSYSTDAINFTDLGTFAVSDSGATSATNGVLDLTCDFSKVTAQYFKITFQFGDDTWLYGSTPAGSKIYFEFVALTEIAAQCYTRPAGPDVSDYVSDGLTALYTADYHSADGKTWYDASGSMTDIDLSAYDAANNYFDDAKGVFVNKATKVYFDTKLAELISTGKFTTEMVIKNTEVLGTSFATYLNSTNDSYALFMRLSNPVYAEFKCGSNVRPKVAVTDKSYFANSTVTITFDAAAGTCCMYVNGVLLQSQVPTGAFNIADFYFGMSDAAKSHNTEYAGFRFYDRALTADEVAANYAADIPSEPITAPDWPAAPADGTAIGIMYVDPDAYGEGMTVLLTEGTTSISWANAIILELDEATGYYKVTNVIPSSGTATDITVPENGFAIVSNMGNDWPTLIANNPGVYDAYAGNPNYISAHNSAWFDAIGAASVGDLFALFGDYYNNESDEQAYYEAGYETYLYLVKVEDGDINAAWGEAPADEDGSATILTTGYDSFTLADGKLTVNDTALRYQYFLILQAQEDGSYVVSQVGNNLVPNDSAFPYEINMSESDLLVAFYYNSENAANSSLYEIYLAALNGDAIYNTAADAGAVVTADLVGGQLRFAVEGGSEESSEETSAETSEETSVETSIEISNETSQEASEEEPPFTGDAGIAALGIISVIALAGVMIIRKKR